MRSLDPQPHQVLIKSKLAPWFVQASPRQRFELTQSMASSHQSRERLAELLGGVQSLLEFSRPLLTQALDAEFGPGLDPERACFFHARFKRQGWNGRRTPDKSGIQTLMQAAWHNFEAKEVVEAGKESISAIYHSDPALRVPGATTIEPASASAKKFIELCRRLDLGGRYQRYLESKLEQPDVERVKAIFVNRERDLLQVEVRIAYLKGLISEPFYTAILSLQIPDAKPTLYGKSFAALYFTVLGVNLRGVLVFQARGQNPCVVYMPSQPSAPLKEYAHFDDFMKELTENARTTQYRQYLQQLIPMRSRALFFSRLEDCLNPYALKDIPGRAGLVKPRLNVRQKNPKANLRPDKRYIAGGLSNYFYVQHMLRLKDDARVLAVPTGDENETSRRERLEGFFEVGMNVLSLAGFVVPGLGEAMLLIAGSQWLVETFEGIDAWTHDDMTEALAHLSSVAESVAMTLLLARAGEAMASWGLPSIKASSVIDRMVAVRSAEGTTRLRYTPESRGGPTSKPVFRMPTRLPDGRLGYLLSGRGGGATSWHINPRQNLINAMTVLFPEAVSIQSHIGGLLTYGETLEGLTTTTLRRLEDFQVLHSAFDAWADPAPNLQAEPLSAQARHTRRTFADALCQAWRYSHIDAPLGSNILLLESIDLLHVVDLPDLPAHYNQIHRMTLQNIVASTEQLDGFLRRFAEIRYLSIVGGGLHALPASLVELELLHNLSIEGQGLIIDQHAMDLLMGIPVIRTLDLSGNTFGQLSEVTREGVIELMLSDTGLTQWPHWVDAMNLRVLDISDNNITALPDAITSNPVDPDSCITVFAYRNPIGVEDLRSYWLNTGSRFNRAYALEFDFPDDILALSPLSSDATEGSTSSRMEYRSHVSGASASIGRLPVYELWLVAGRAELNSRFYSAWERIQEQGDAPYLMILLQRLTETADFMQYREELTNDVITVLQAASTDDALRVQIEAMANNRLVGPDQTCEDGVRLIFSDIQVAAYAHTAMLGVPAKEQTERLLGVIRRMFRLSEAQSIADRDIAQRIASGVQVDQAEVRLAYRIGLSSYLALPGQPLSMTWERLADVSTQAVLDARRVIEAREAGHEFLQFAVNDRLWNARLRTEHAAQLEQATATIRGQMDVLEEHPPADLDEYDRQGRALIALRDDAEQQLLMQLTDHYRNARY